MTCDCSDYETPTVYRERTQIARKRHRCSECGGTVYPGEQSPRLGDVRSACAGWRGRLACCTVRFKRGIQRRAGCEVQARGLLHARIGVRVQVAGDARFALPVGADKLRVELLVRLDRGGVQLGDGHVLALIGRPSASLGTAAP